MTFRNTQYLLQVNADGTFRHGQVDRVEVLPGGREVSAPPLDFEQAEISDILDQFNSNLLQENVTLKAQAIQAAIDQQNQSYIIESQTAAVIQAKNDQIASLTSQLASAQSQLVTTGNVRNQVETLQNELIAAQGRMNRLIEQLAFNPRELTVESFLNRLTQTELLMLFADTDPVIQQIAGMLKEWATKHWPVHLDSDNTRNSIGYLVSVGKLSPDRVQIITSDASREESVPPVIS